MNQEEYSGPSKLDKKAICDMVEVEQSLRIRSRLYSTFEETLHSIFVDYEFTTFTNEELQDHKRSIERIKNILGSFEEYFEMMGRLRTTIDMYYRENSSPKEARSLYQLIENVDSKYESIKMVVRRIERKIEDMIEKK